MSNSESSSQRKDQVKRSCKRCTRSPEWSGDEYEVKNYVVSRRRRSQSVKCSVIFQRTLLPEALRSIPGDNRYPFADVSMKCIFSIKTASYVTHAIPPQMPPGDATTFSAYLLTDCLGSSLPNQGKNQYFNLK